MKILFIVYHSSLKHVLPEDTGLNSISISHFFNSLIHLSNQVVYFASYLMTSERCNFGFIKLCLINFFAYFNDVLMY